MISGGLNGQQVRVVEMPSADGVQYTGIQVLGPRGAIHGATWLGDPATVDRLIEILQQARKAMLDA